MIVLVHCMIPALSTSTRTVGFLLVRYVSLSWGVAAGAIDSSDGGANRYSLKAVIPVCCACTLLVYKIAAV